MRLTDCRLWAAFCFALVVTVPAFADVEQFDTRQNLKVTAGGKTVEVCVTPAVTASNAYGANDVVGGLLTFSTAFLGSGSGIVENVSVNIKKVESSGFTLALFNSNPSNTTWTDASAAAINASDVFAVRDVISLTASSALGTHTNLVGSNLAFAIAPGTTTLYGVLLSNATLTNNFGSTSDVNVCLQILQDL